MKEMEPAKGLWNHWANQCQQYAKGWPELFLPVLQAALSQNFLPTLFFNNYSMLVEPFTVTSLCCMDSHQSPPCFPIKMSQYIFVFVIVSTHL